MFGLFKDKEEEQAPEWLPLIKENQERFFVFIDKLEDKMKELCEAAIPELKTTFETDEDLYKRAYGRLLSGIKGQLENIRKKVYDVYDEKVIDVMQDLKSSVSISSPYHDQLYDFRNACSDKNNAFDEKYRTWLDALNETAEQDLEIKYQEILTEFEAIKNKFACKQCGSNITIEKIFFISTYLTCPSCQTQNTFEPSTQAKGLESLGRSLAEQRTAHLLQAYEAEKAMERTLYHERHTLSLSRINEDDKKEVERLNQKMTELESQRQAAIKNAPGLYEIYLRAMFDEWNKIVPDLAVENEKFYDRMLADHRNYN
jgi:RNA polymerase-binding transcription factor DksA